jgi:hypothetical protein
MPRALGVAKIWVEAAVKKSSPSLLGEDLGRYRFRPVVVINF